MFGNKGNENDMQAPAATTAPARSTSTGSQPARTNTNNITAYLGPDVRIEGTLHFESSVLIEGEFKGEIVSENGQLTIGEKARVEGDLDLDPLALHVLEEGLNLHHVEADVVDALAPLAQEGRRLTKPVVLLGTTHLGQLRGSRFRSLSQLHAIVA